MAGDERQWARPGEAQPPPADSWQAWVKELRDRTHDLAERIGMIAAEMEVAKRERASIADELEAARHDRQKLHAALEADKIAERVEQKLNERRRFWTSLWTRGLAGCATAVTIAGAVKILIGG